MSCCEVLLAMFSLLCALLFCDVDVVGYQTVCFCYLSFYFLMDNAAFVFAFFGFVLDLFQELFLGLLFSHPRQVSSFEVFPLREVIEKLILLSRNIVDFLNNWVFHLYDLFIE